MEIWKPIDGFDGNYQVSNLGNVQNLNWRSPGTVRNLTPVHDRDGYLVVCLSAFDGTQKSMRVHRLVAAAFLDDFDEAKTVNHKNEIRSDNRLENLECLTIKENNNYGGRNKRVSESKKNTNCKKVIQKALDGKVLQEWVSLREVVRNTGYDASLISRVCRGVKNTAYGFRWEYKEDDDV